ncbi:class I SAM-dependent methyltransferase [Nocardioides sp.]|uniref:class I SAM-dependent methyltransferase n=1 Tax=Nocardioides sp. TaxID=35761 RepID=UPI002725E195|nr:class I SAM-dependent methyltransferase [Nocardioides sp.]MDO9455948.1 class I SAM-dependent methyltransferase [Nocardioides sp.]
MSTRHEMVDRGQVQTQYRTEEGLTTRSSVWHPTADGREPAAEALAEVVAAAPQRVLEIGCGTGAFAARVAAALPDAGVVAVDQSPRMVELTASWRLEARVADAQDLPFADGSFDAVAALWMLYHVPDLHRGLAEVRRVLRPGGTFVAVTNGDEHLADLRRDAGGAPVVTHFSSENGDVALHAHFDDVRRQDLVTRAWFADRAAALGYLDSTREGVAWSPPVDGWPREYAGHVTVFVAR